MFMHYFTIFLFLCLPLAAMETPNNYESAKEEDSNCATKNEEPVESENPKQTIKKAKLVEIKKTVQSSPSNYENVYGNLGVIATRQQIKMRSKQWQVIISKHETCPFCVTKSESTPCAAYIAWVNQNIKKQNT